VILKEAPTFRVIVLPFDDSLKVGVVAPYEKEMPLPTKRVAITINRLLARIPLNDMNR